MDEAFEQSFRLEFPKNTAEWKAVKYRLHKYSQHPFMVNHTNLRSSNIEGMQDGTNYCRPLQLYDGDINGRSENCLEAILKPKCSVLLAAVDVRTQ